MRKGMDADSNIEPGAVTSRDGSITAIQTSPLVLAIDVGRSFTNYLGTDMKGPEGFPSRAARIEDAPRTMDGGFMEGAVMVGDEAWIAALPPRTQHQSLHHDGFYKEPAYQALVLEAISRAGSREIDRLELGLPTFSCGPENKAELAAIFAGKQFDISGDGELYTINDVDVFDQALGPIATMTLGSSANVAYGDRLVLDFGLRTTDAAVVSKDWNIDQRYSMSSQVASMAVIEEAARNLPVRIDVEEIDARLRSGELAFTMGKVEVDIQTAIDEAARTVTPDLIAEITGKYKNFNHIGAIVLAGGGAPIFHQPFVDGFADQQHIEVLLLDDPATATVRGFKLIGDMKCVDHR